MKWTIELTPSELNEAVAAWLKDKGTPTSGDLTVTISKDAPGLAVPVPERAPSLAPIGKIIEGVKITHYGYPGDSSPDSNSMKGIGDRANKLVPNLSVAMTAGARSSILKTTGSSTGKKFQFGGFTFQDDDSAPESDQRIDVYDPYYTGVDIGCTPEMLAKSKEEMVASGILPA